MSSLIEQSLNIAGGITYWNGSDGTELEELRDAFQEVGLAEYVPDSIHTLPSLRRALRNLFPRRSHIIKDLREGKQGYVVGRLVEVDGQSDMEWEQDLLVMMFKPTIESTDIKLVIRTDDAQLRADVRQQFDIERERMPASELGQVLTKVVLGLGGIPVRAKGGVYWLPEGDIETWNKAAEAVRRVNAHNNLYLMRTTTDPGTLEAICDAVVHQVDRELEAIIKALEDDADPDIEKKPMGERALETRRKDCIRLSEHAQRYESLLNTSLQSLLDKSDEVQSTLFVASQALA